MLSFICALLTVSCTGKGTITPVTFDTDTVQVDTISTDTADCICDMDTLTIDSICVD